MRRRVRGLFPRGPAANKEYSFILLHTSADQRSGGVSGALRGGQGRETGRGARALDSSLVTALPVPWICSRIPYPESRIPVLQPLVTVFVSGCGWRESARRRCFSFSQGRRWTATGVLTSRRGQGAPRSACRGDEGSLPEGPRRQQRIFLHPSPHVRRSTKRGSVGGTARGPRTGNGTRGSCCRLVTCHCTSPALDLLPYPVSRVPYPGSPTTCHCLRVRLLVRVSARGRAAQESVG
jgi:hypothetical protein